jgi:predicted 2-oxoglutarate/Fe(II)-dependent dioxygenase YbiX
MVAIETLIVCTAAGSKTSTSPTRKIRTPAHPALVQLTGVYHNLLRRWADV